MRSRAPFSSSGAASPRCRFPGFGGAGAPAEAAPPHIGGAYLDIRDLRREYQEAATLLIGQTQDAGRVGQRVGDQLLHLAWCLRAVEDQLARAVGNTDLDLHAGPFPFVCSSSRR